MNIDTPNKFLPNCPEGLFKELWKTEFWAGRFVWKWFPNMDVHENYPERDYSPQGKLSWAVLRLEKGNKIFHEQNEVSQRSSYQTTLSCQITRWLPAR